MVFFCDKKIFKKWYTLWLFFLFDVYFFIRNYLCKHVYYYIK